MNQRVAVLAGAAHGELRPHPGLCMADRMAPVAEPWPRHLQQELVDRAMRIVAVQAILAHRRVLKEERPTLFGVALVAIVVDRDLAQEPFGGATVRIVTIRTGDLPLAYRHVRGAEELGLALLVTLEAGVGLPRCL